MRYATLLLVFLAGCSLERNRDFEVTCSVNADGVVHAWTVTNTEAVVFAPDLSGLAAHAELDDDAGRDLHTFLSALRYDTVATATLDPALTPYQLLISGEVIPQRDSRFSTPRHPVWKAAIVQLYAQMPPALRRALDAQTGVWKVEPTSTSSNYH